MAPQQHPDREALAKELCGKFDACDQGIHSRLRERWDSFDRDYHNYRDLTDAVATASPRDRDAVLRDGRHEFGHQLFIPMTYATVESTLAQLMANPPHPVVLPARKSTRPQAAQNMGYLIADQQERCDLELEFQAAGKEALRLGIGVVKTRWQRTMRDIERVRSSQSGNGYALTEVSEAVFDGPIAERVNMRDFLWDPMGHNIKTVRYVFHREWRDSAYVLGRMRSAGKDGDGEPLPPAWSVLTATNEEVPLTAEDLKSSSGAEKYSETRRGGLQARGFEGTLDTSKLGDIHEVWEFHDGVRIVLVVDRKWVVAEFRNPTRKTRLPFHVFRPTDTGFFEGKGVIEPMRDLQLELNDLRTDRRWNALMALHQFFFYDENALDADDAVIFPGAMIPTRGNPNELVRQGNVKDIPGSAVQEEEALKGDIYMVSGQNDPTDQSAAPETATGVQLVQAATKHRMNLMVRRAEREFAVPVGRHWIELNQREVLAKVDVRRPLPAPDPSEPDRLFEMIELSPEELMGELDYTIVGNSMAAENIPQQRQDAQTLLSLLSNPMFASEPLAQEIVRKLGFVNPQAYLAPKAPPVPTTLPAKLAEIVGQEQANAIMAAAQAEEANQNGR